MQPCLILFFIFTMVFGVLVNVLPQVVVVGVMHILSRDREITQNRLKKTPKLFEYLQNEAARGF